MIGCVVTFTVAFSFQKGSFIQMLDGLGYTCMSLAVFMSAPVFAGGRLANWIRGVPLRGGLLGTLQDAGAQ